VPQQRDPRVRRMLAMHCPVNEREKSLVHRLMVMPYKLRSLRWQGTAQQLPQLPLPP